MMPTPRARSLSILSKRTSTSRWVMAEVGSSIRMTLASIETAFRISIIWMSETVRSRSLVVGA